LEMGRQLDRLANRGQLRTRPCDPDLV
jgi:hypothetical protein